MKHKARQQQEASLHAHQGAVGKAIQWLHRRYGDAVDEWITDVWFDSIDPNFGEVPEHLAEALQINAMEMMLVEGHFKKDGDDASFMDLLLGKGGPLMHVEERQYLQTLQQAPLRLWEVSEILPGVGLTLTDCMDETCVRHVQERSASMTLQQWDIIGARPVKTPAGHWELSGASYHFPRDKAEALQRYLMECLEGVPEEEQTSTFSNILAFDWLQMVLNPQALTPQLMDAATGESMMLITDYYRVNDWAKLEEALDSAVDVHGDRKKGWTRFQNIDQDSYRSLGTITVSEKKDRIELFAKSLKGADDLQAWFEHLVGAAALYLTRKISDPLSLLSEFDEKKSPSTAQIPGDVKQQMEHDYKRNHYAGWCDEALPALDGKTPREAIATAVGKKTVVNLLKDFENYEAGAEFPFDFGFLWEELNLDR